MIARIIEYSARNKFVVILFVASAIAWGIWALKNTPLDAIPDLSDTQVIIYTEWLGRSPDLIEDQITYPISSTLLAAPKVQAVRGFSFLGSSFIYVIFEEGTDIYWARSRILEYLQAVKNKLPADVNPILGPDATSLGWGFSYAVVDETGQHDLAQLRSIQDYNLKLALESVPGVSQVASIGGFVKQYQVTVDPNRLAAFNIPITKVIEAVRKSNRDVEGRVLELSGVEYMVRGRGYIQTTKDLEDIPVGAGSGRDAGLSPGRGTCSDRPGNPAGPGGPRRAGRGGGRDRRRPVRRKRPERHRAGQGAAEAGYRAQSSQGGEDRHDLRPFRSDPPGHRHPQGGDPQAHHRRQRRLHRLPLSSAQRARGHLHASRRDHHLLHLHVLPGRDLQHHEPFRHRHRHRGDGGRLHHHGGKRPQESWRSGRRQGSPGAASRSSSRRPRRWGRRSSFRSSSSPWGFCPSSPFRPRRAGSSNRWPTRRPSPCSSPPFWR